MSKNQDLLNEAIKENQFLKNVIKASDIGVWQWDIKNDIFLSNNRLTNMLGYRMDEYPKNKNARFSLIDPYSRDKVQAHLELVLKRNIDQYSMEYRIKHKDGHWVWIEDIAQVVTWSKNGEPLVMAGIHKNITVRKIAETKLKESEERFRLLVNTMPLGMVIHKIVCDEFGEPIDYTFFDANKMYEEQTGLKMDDVRGKTVLEVMPNTEKYWIEKYGEVALRGKTIEFENYSQEINKYFKVIAFSPQKNYFAVLVNDITKEKERLMEIEYLSNHDYLSGLYNRRYFVEKYNELDSDERNYPISVMMLDVNGLKIINDALGHEIGDELIQRASKAMLDVFNTTDVVCRVGGDEFAVIMPNSKHERVEEVKILLKKELNTIHIKNMHISIATGYETKSSGSTLNLDDILKSAENYMYRHKVTEGVSVRNNAIKAIFKTLTDKYEEERVHSHKVSAFCKKIGVELGVQGDNLKELELAALFHDIGKISLPDAILYKPGKLTDDEYTIVKSHSEVGYQILRAADEYSDLAVHALYHHERWDGFGYPSGKKGLEIPLFSRIICVADSFEAMTAKRPYKNVMTDHEAIKEIVRCAGKQFDPDIAKVFVTKVLEKEWKD